MNQVTLLGHAGGPAEYKEFDSGACKGIVRLATSRRWKDKQGEWKTETDWHNVQGWDWVAKTMRDKVEKGSTVLVQGELKTDNYEKDGSKRTFIYVNANRLTVILVQKREQREQQEEGSDDLPF